MPTRLNIFFTPHRNLPKEKLFRTKRFLNFKQFLCTNQQTATFRFHFSSLTVFLLIKFFHSLFLVVLIIATNLIFGVITYYYCDINSNGGTNQLSPSLLIPPYFFFFMTPIMQKRGRLAYLFFSKISLLHFIKRIYNFLVDHLFELVDVF